MNGITHIFIIIVTYCGRKWYDRSIGQWFSCPIIQSSDCPTALHVVVVDNSPTTDDVTYIQTTYPDVHIIRTGENLCFAKSNNLGLRYALDNGADYVLLLNHDAWFKNAADLLEMVRISEQHPEYWVVAPLQVYANSGRIERETERHIERSCTADYDWLTDAYRGQLKEVYPSEYSCAYCWLLPRKTVETIGGFDPLFFHYGEDDNYQQRVHYHGGLVGMCPKIEVYHDIEDRPAAFRDENLDWRKYLIIRNCDVNVHGTIADLIKKERKQLIYMFLRLQLKHIKNLLPEYKYLKLIEKDIHSSRETNKRKGENWL